MKSIIAAFLVAGVVLPSVPAAAQTAGDPAAAPTAAASADPAPSTSAPTPICTDRPTKANIVCTAPQGGVQVEADAINSTRFSSGDVDTDS